MTEQMGEIIGKLNSLTMSQINSSGNGLSSNTPTPNQNSANNPGQVSGQGGHRSQHVAGYDVRQKKEVNHCHFWR